MVDLLRRRYTSAQRALAERMRSRLNVARAVLMTRLERGFSQEEVAKRAGTKQSRISEIEASKGNLRFDTLDRVATALDLMVDLVPRRTATVDTLVELGEYAVLVETRSRVTLASQALYGAGYNQAVEMAG
jgi:transcriptional regulator with XRE-family HTH domain